jgi:hypothetical protein
MDDLLALVARSRTYVDVVVDLNGDVNLVATFDATTDSLLMV